MRRGSNGRGKNIGLGNAANCAVDDDNELAAVAAAATAVAGVEVVTDDELTSDDDDDSLVDGFSFSPYTQAQTIKHSRHTGTQTQTTFSQVLTTMTFIPTS